MTRKRIGPVLLSLLFAVMNTSHTLAQGSLATVFDQEEIEFTNLPTRNYTSFITQTPGVVDSTVSNLLEQDGGRCGENFYIAAINRGPTANHLYFYSFVGEQQEPIKQTVLQDEIIYSLNFVCFNNQIPGLIGVFASDSEDAGSYDGVVYSQDSIGGSFTRETIVEGNIASVDAENRDDGTAVALFANNLGFYDVYNGVPGNWNSLFKVDKPGGFLGNPWYSLKKPQIGTWEDDFTVAFEQDDPSGAFTNVFACRLTQTGEMVWEKQLFRDSPPSVAPALFEQDIIARSETMFFATFHRSNLCHEVFFLDPETGEFQRKPMALTNEPVYDKVSELEFFGLNRNTVGLSSWGPGINPGRYQHFLSFFSQYANDLNGETDEFGPVTGIPKLESTFQLDDGDHPTGASFKVRYDQAWVNDNWSGIPGAQKFLISSYSNSLNVLPIAIGMPSLNFPQFADGDGIFSQIIFTSLDSEDEVNVTLLFKDQDGQNTQLDRNGNQLIIPGTTVNGEIGLNIPPLARRTLQTDGNGPIKVGAVTGFADGPVNAVIVFGGSIGLAGVPATPTFFKEFTVPIDSIAGGQVATGLAVMNREDRETVLTLTLYSSTGEVITTAQVKIPAMGQIALFASQFDWVSSGVNFDNFRGAIKASTDGRVSAVAIQTRNGIQFATLPVDGN